MTEWKSLIDLYLCFGRGEVWQRLSGASEKMESTIENYRILVTKETPDEKVIIVGRWWILEQPDLIGVPGDIPRHPQNFPSA